MENTTAKKHNFVIIGALWLDKVNGNTYHRAKILDPEFNDVFYTDGLQYGYGSAYMDTAKREILKQYRDDEIGVVMNGGAFWLNKREIQKGWF